MVFCALLLKREVGNDELKTMRPIFAWSFKCGNGDFNNVLFCLIPLVNYHGRGY
jgi:hypothetical protein